MNWFRLKTCIKCQGDLAADEGDWLCLQCGTYYYTGLYQLPTHEIDSPPAQYPSPPKQPDRKMLGAGMAPSFAASQTPAPRAVTRICATVASL